MEKKGARLFQRVANTLDHGRNIVELEVLESRRNLRKEVNELIQLANNSSTSTDEMQQRLFLSSTRLGTFLPVQLLRSLHRNDPQERESIIWLLILLNDTETIEPLHHISQDKRNPRSIRLSASMALAGMGATAETKETHQHKRLYAIS
jgi:hypothetical protein